MAKKQATNQDSVILKLQEQIEKKEQELLNISKPVWKTNNNLEVFGGRYNLHIQSVEALVLLFSYIINIFKNLEESYELLEIRNTELKYNGYTYSDYFHDISLHIAIKNKRIKEEQIANLKKRLNNLLSDELKTKLELEAINKALETM